MKPLRIFLFFLGILAIMAVFASIFPEKGIKIGKNVTLNFPNLKKLFIQEETTYKDISSIVESNLPIDTLAPVIDTTKKDTFRVTNDTIQKEKDSFVTKEEEQKQHVRKPQIAERELQYPDDNPQILYPFFNILDSLNHNKELIRILHYGDSQIEGDRISSYLRNQLQQKFGGSGIGLFPAVLPFNTQIPLKLNHSKSWERYTLKDKSNFQHRKFGLLMSFSRFSPYYSNYQNEVYEGTINIKRSPIAYNLVSEFTQCRIFYGFNEEPFIVKLDYQGEVADAEIIPATRSLKSIEWSTPADLNEITISFNGEHSPNIYGIALDGEKGIALDNIPLRGSRGTNFTNTDMSFYKSMLENLNVKLLLMHFGVNVVPQIRDNYKFYEDQFYQQLKKLKSLEEDLNIIVMGVTDMSRKSGGLYESYPNIEKIRDAQKAAAFRADCAFWDTYMAMGGENSMPSWVFADPPLARKDFTHFTYRGSVVIAKMFYKALIKDYLEYQNVKQNQSVSSKKDSI